VIANIGSDGADGGNLTIAAKHIEYRDLFDYARSESYGAGLNVSKGRPTDRSYGFDKGRTQISVTHEGHESEGITRATIGFGTIIIDGKEQTDIASLNRDVATVQEITRDIITGALDINLTVDHRVFTDEGRAEIALDIKRAVDGVKMLFSADARTQRRAVNIIQDMVTQILAEQGKTELEIIEAMKRLENREVKDTIGILAIFDSSKSITDNIQDYINLKGGQLDSDFIARMGRRIDDPNATDHGLLTIFVGELFTTLDSNGIINPINLIVDSLGLNVHSVEVISPVPGGQNATVDIASGNLAGLTGESRSLGTGTCAIQEDCGHMGALREISPGVFRPHDGHDYISMHRDAVVAPTEVIIDTVSAMLSQPNLNFMEFTETRNGQPTGNLIRILYVEPRAGLASGQPLSQGDIIGHTQDISRNYRNTVNHIHFEIRDTSQPSRGRIPGRPIDPLSVIGR
jgi:hypothetical protein